MLTNLFIYFHYYRQNLKENRITSKSLLQSLLSDGYAIFFSRISAKQVCENFFNTCLRSEYHQRYLLQRNVYNVGLRSRAV